MGAKTLRGDPLRVLRRLRLIVRPSDAGRERGDNGRGDFHVPSGHRAQRVSEALRLGVPTLGSVEVEERSLGEKPDERFGGAVADGEVTVGGGAVHARIVPDAARPVNPQRREYSNISSRPVTTISVALPR